MKSGIYVPITPGGSACLWLASGAEDAAWDRLTKEYPGTKASLVHLGYTVEFWEDFKS
jgi:hypothetical protein